MEGYSRQRRVRQTRPLFVVGYEGATELNYVDSIIRHHGMACRRAGDAENRPEILLAVTSRVAERERRKSPGRLIVPIIVLDIEVMSDDNIQELQTFAAEAKAQGIHVVVNRPKIEHWFLQHFQPAAENMSSTTVDARLAHHLQTNNLPSYTKPGSQSFFAALAQASDDALKHCKASGHSAYGLPCMCQPLMLVKDYASGSRSSSSSR